PPEGPDGLITVPAPARNAEPENEDGSAIPVAAETSTTYGRTHGSYRSRRPRRAARPLRRLRSGRPDGGGPAEAAAHRGRDRRPRGRRHDAPRQDVEVAASPTSTVSA